MEEISGYAMASFGLLASVFAWLGYSIVRRGVRNALGLAVCSGLYFLYVLVVPVSDAVLRVQQFFGFHFPPTYWLNARIGLIYSVGISAFAMGYFSFGKRFSAIRFSAEVVSPEGKQQLIHWQYGLQAIIWVAIVLNMTASGVSVINLLNFSNQSEKDILFSIDWKYPALDLFVNCLSVSLFIIFWLQRKINAGWLAAFALWLVFCLLAGWRYRILLMMIFGVCYLIRYQNIGWRWWVTTATLLPLMVAWLTLNRMALAKRNFHLITNDLTQFDFSVFTNELSNSRTFKASVLYLEKQHIPNGGLRSWVEYVGNKFVPKTAFPENQRPRPWILKVTKDWIPDGWPWNPNPAVSQMEEFFLTFSWMGMVVGMFIMGVWVSVLDVPTQNSVFQVFQLVGIGFCFQWISRGFFLYQIQIAFVSLVPFLVLILAKRYLPPASHANTA